MVTDVKLLESTERTFSKEDTDRYVEGEHSNAEACGTWCWGFPKPEGFKHHNLDVPALYACGSMST